MLKVVVVEDEELVRLNAVIVPLHQLRNARPALTVKAQAIHRPLRNAAGYHAMSHEMSDSFFVQRKTFRLSHIVKQNRPPQQRCRWRGLHRVQCVLPNIVAVVRVSLVKAEHRQNLRQNRPHNLRKVPQHRRRGWSAQQLCQLLPHPLRRDFPQQLPAILHSRRRFPLHGEVQHRREPQAPQNSQRILGKALLRLSHTAEHTVFQILPAMEGVMQSPGKFHCHGVYRKIPPGKVLLQRICKSDLLRVAVIRVSTVRAERCCLHPVHAATDRDRTVLQSRR